MVYGAQRNGVVSVALADGERGLRIMVRIHFNQLKYGYENVLSANGTEVIYHVYNELVFCRRKFVIVITI